MKYCLLFSFFLLSSLYVSAQTVEIEYRYIADTTNSIITHPIAQKFLQIDAGGYDWKCIGSGGKIMCTNNAQKTFSVTLDGNQKEYTYYWAFKTVGADLRNSLVTFIDSRTARLNGPEKRVFTKWKLQEKYSTINGYKCQMATGEFPDQVSVRAWFTEKIAVQIAPAEYAGLPGAVLFLEINEETGIKKTYEAKYIKVKEENTKL